MKLGMQVGLDPGHIVLDGDPAPPPAKRHSLPPPIFCPYLLWANDWMDHDASRPKRHCLRWWPSYPPRKGGEPPNFRLISIVVIRLDWSRWHLAWRWASVHATLC